MKFPSRIATIPCYSRSMAARYHSTRTRKIVVDQERICRTYELPHNLRTLLERIHQLTETTDQRKELEFQLHVVFHRILHRLAIKLGVEDKNLKFILPEEFPTYRDSPHELMQLAKERENSTWIVQYTPDGPVSSMGDEARTLEKELISGLEEVVHIKGSIGSKGSGGLIQGVAKILLSPREIEKIMPGDILVTSMTSPEFVPAMRRSAAIITDEGGITCHAAIVSRELGLPCIIGTKNATKILKDGDRIEMDVVSGNVRVIT